MASPDKRKQKILKAKKTMPISSRKQMDILNKPKNVEALKTTERGSNIPNGNSCLISGNVSSTCIRSETVDSSFGSNNNSVFPQKSIASSQNLTKPGEIVGSEKRLNNTDEQMCLYQKPRMTEDSSSKFSIREAKDSQNTEVHYKHQLNVSGCTTKNEKNFIQKSVCFPPIVLNGTAQSTSDDKRIDKMVSSLKANSRPESHDKSQNDILCSNSYLVSAEKTPNLVNSVSSSSCSATMLKTNDFCRTCHSGASNCEHAYLQQLSLLSINGNNGHNQKKRMSSQNKESVKRMKTSEEINESACVSLGRQTTLLEQVKHLIRQELCKISYKVLDEKLNELSERIGKTQCRNKHEAIACELFVKIGRLQRRMEAVLSSETDCLEPTILSSNTVCRTANSKTKNLDKNQEAANGPNKSVTLVSPDPLQPSEKTNQRINLSVNFVSESNIDDVILLSVENPHLKMPITSHPTEIRKTTLENFSSSSNAKFRVAEKKKIDFVIDLTREDVPNCNTENPAPTLMCSSKADLTSKEISPVAENGVEESDSFKHLPPLPEPPPLRPELTDKMLATLPPQKPKLRVKWVLRPLCIALIWNILKINPKCAPVESYHLFLCCETSKDKLTWKKIGEIKASPLPMACTLSQFLTASKYYFAIQSKDIFGRYGPFCDIKSIPGFSENLT